MKRIGRFIRDNLCLLIMISVSLLCTLFLIFGQRSENGFITLNGKDAKIEEYTEEFIESANDAMNRIMNQDKPTDDITESVYNEPTGQGFSTTLEDILARRLSDGHNDNGNGWQCSRYTGWLATGKWSYSTLHPDYGPVNGKDIASWLVRNYGFKYIEKPIKGAIGSGGFNTIYGHTAMFIESTGSNTALVSDANYIPLTVATHNMNIEGWVWVVPANYEPTQEPVPTPTTDSVDEYVVVKGDTLGGIAIKMGWCNGCKLFGDDGYAQKLAEHNNIPNRGLIYPNQIIRKY